MLLYFHVIVWYVCVGGCTLGGVRAALNIKEIRGGHEMEYDGLLLLSLFSLLCTLRTAIIGSRTLLRQNSFFSCMING